MSSNELQPTTITGPPYPDDELNEYEDDNGTMPENVATLAEYVVGHRIVAVEDNATVKVRPARTYDDGTVHGFVITLDNGIRVVMAATNDCCAYTELERFLLHAPLTDHAITGVATTDGYTRWHIYADAGDVLELEVGWSAGNPFYYGYGFDILVVPLDGEVVEPQQELGGQQRALPGGGA